MTVSTPRDTPVRRAKLSAAAEYAGTSIKTLRRRIADGTLPGYRLGARMIVVDLDDVDEEDEKFLHEMIQKHYHLTASSVAKFILNDFESQMKNFVKVFPQDYKKVLKSARAAASWDRPR